MLELRTDMAAALKRGEMKSAMLALLLAAAMVAGLARPAESAGGASLLPGETLTGKETRMSDNGVFKLGFFNLNSSDMKWYLGTWYAKASQFTVAWIANRENPLPDADSAVLTLNRNGSLVLSRRSGGALVWSSGGAGKSASSAVIQDSGNWVILGAANKSEILWQSFDQPGNTWIPGMKIGLHQKITAWKSQTDVTPGPYALQMNPSGANSFVLIWNQSQIYWDSGVWNNQTFAGVPEMNQNFIYDFSFFDNGTDKYFTYSIKPNLASSWISRFELAYTGEIRVYTLIGSSSSQWNMFWKQPRTPCEVYAACGPYASCNNNNLEKCSCATGFQPKDEDAWNSQDWAAGCARKTDLACVAGGRNAADGFVETTYQSLPDQAAIQNNATTAAGKPLSCRDACLQNCSCTAYAMNGTCLHWHGELQNLQDGDGATVYIRLNARDVPSSGGGHGTTVAVAAIGGGVAVIAVIAGVAVFCFCWRRRARKNSKSAVLSAPASLRVFSYRDLHAATKNFSDRLGGGGFGSVFRGILADGTAVAVKKLEGTTQGEKQFRTEVSTIGNIQHVNLVRLCGFCSEGENRLLVYEFMPNGSLGSALFQNSPSSAPMNWSTRYKIAVGTARGIVYLHEQCRDCIIHCDIKPENILLDADFNAKVSDFGLAKLLGREYSHVLTTMRGTRGYLAPEWLSGLPITPKADVYSFGMTLLEIISGRRNQAGGAEYYPSAGAAPVGVYFPAWAAAEISRGNAAAVADARVEVNEEELWRACTAVLWCIQDDETERPNMRDVLQVLKGVVAAPALPSVPASLQSMLQQQPPESLVFYWKRDSASTNPDNTNTSGSETILPPSVSLSAYSLESADSLRAQV